MGEQCTTKIGNTNQSSHSGKSVKRCSSAKSWTLTLNNPEEGDMSLLSSCFEKYNGKYIIGREGENFGSTHHLQGYVRLPKRFRPLEKFRDYPLVSRGHWEIARGSEEDNRIYCSKEGGEILSNLVSEELIVPKMYGWQRGVIDLLKEEPDNRSIMWYWSEDGGQGKSALARYLAIVMDAMICAHGRAADMIYQIASAKIKPRICVFDIPLSGSQPDFAGLEQIKNGIMASSKYESGMVKMNYPHILVLANFEPFYHKMSDGRFKVTELPGDPLVEMEVSGDETVEEASQRDWHGKHGEWNYYDDYEG